MCQDHAPELFQGIQLLWLRLDAPQGIAFARSLGGDAARGEALVTRRKQCGRGIGKGCKVVHSGKLTWNPKMEVWKMICLFNCVIFRFQPLIFRGVFTLA